MVRFVEVTEPMVRARLAELEARYGMSSTEFRVRWEAGTIDECPDDRTRPMDYFEWAAECDRAERMGILPSRAAPVVP